MAYGVELVGTVKKVHCGRWQTEDMMIGESENYPTS